MPNMSDLSVALQATEKSCTFTFKDTTLETVACNSLGMLPRQNWIGFKRKDLFSINK